mmetsp:Transcript_25884/g.46051  ORF Transcript_25884/g.46051 Transcript_25884/m.46051 type:complete len:251 (+) Transcript_25884:109-861(+)
MSVLLRPLAMRLARSEDWLWRGARSGRGPPSSCSCCASSTSSAPPGAANAVQSASSSSQRRSSSCAAGSMTSASAGASAPGTFDSPGRPAPPRSATRHSNSGSPAWDGEPRETSRRRRAAASTKPAMPLRRPTGTSTAAVPNLANEDCSGTGSSQSPRLFSTSGSHRPGAGLTSEARRMRRAVACRALQLGCSSASSNSFGSSPSASMAVSMTAAPPRMSCATTLATATRWIPATGRGVLGLCWFTRFAG